MHECYVLACMGPYLSQIWMDQKYKSIYGIRRSCQTSLSTYFTPRTQASMHARYVLACRGSYLSQIGPDRSIYGIGRTYKTYLSTWYNPSTQGSVHSFKLEGIREIISMESGDHARPPWAHTSPPTSKLACMHPMCLRAQAHILAKLGWIREIKIYMESVEHAQPHWAHNLTRVHKLACMQC